MVNASSGSFPAALGSAKLSNVDVTASIDFKIHVTFELLILSLFSHGTPRRFCCF